MFRRSSAAVATSMALTDLSSISGRVRFLDKLGGSEFAEGHELDRKWK
jgi:hypothetical protein